MKQEKTPAAPLPQLNERFKLETLSKMEFWDYWVTVGEVQIYSGWDNVAAEAAYKTATTLKREAGKTEAVQKHSRFRRIANLSYKFSKDAKQVIALVRSIVPQEINDVMMYELSNNVVPLPLMERAFKMYPFFFTPKKTEL